MREPGLPRGRGARPEGTLVGAAGLEAELPLGTPTRVPWGHPRVCGGSEATGAFTSLPKLWQNYFVCYVA